MIELKNVNIVFNAETPREVRALKSVSLDVGSGEFVVVLGGNGSGKSTLLNVIAGTLQPASGDVFIAGKKMNGKKEFERSAHIARIFQDPFMGTASALTMEENFRLASLRSRSKRLTIGINNKFREHIKEKISLLNLGLENKLQQPMGTLSGGQRQALTLAMAVMDKAEILLLDEPVAALNPKTADLIMSKTDELIKKFKLTALLVTHSLRDAQRYGNRIIVMEDGCVIKNFQENEKAGLSSDEMLGWF